MSYTVNNLLNEFWGIMTHTQYQRKVKFERNQT